MRVHLTPLLRAACVLAAATALHGCRGEDIVCTAIACGPALVARVDLASSPPANATATACHGEVCVEATLPAAGATPGTGAGVTFSGQDVTGVLWTRPDGSLQLEVDWSGYASPPVASGDAFRVTVATNGGALLAQVEGTASELTSSRPNGAECPPVCLSAGAIGDAP